MHAFFVHGMGRSPASGWWLLRRLRAAGIETSTFGYRVWADEFDDIVHRLVEALAALPQHVEVVLIGHSLGGVLLRQALAAPGLGPLRVHRLVLLGSPVTVSHFAQRVRTNLFFRAITGDCGQLLGSAARMSSVPVPSVSTLGIAGTRGVDMSRRSFGSEPNDGVVSVSEVSAPWLTEQVLVPVVHTWLPSRGLVATVLLDRLKGAR